MPFDGKRMIFGGFASIVDKTAGPRGGYVDGYVVAVPERNKEAYLAMAEQSAHAFMGYGATRVVEAWGDDVPVGKITDFKGAVKAANDERVVFSWIEWPSKQVRDDAWTKRKDDKRARPDKNGMPFDGQRMIYGGFQTLLDR